MGESYILMAITKMNIDKGSAPVLVQGVSRGPRKTKEKAFEEVSKLNVKFGYVFIFTEPKLYSPDITGRTNRSFSLQPDLLIVKLQQGMSIPPHQDHIKRRQWSRTLRVMLIGEISMIGCEK